MITVGTEDALVSRLLYLLTDVDKPIAFVAGSGLTRGNVAGVDRLVTAMRASLGNDFDQQRFDASVVGLTWGDKYQQAAEFLLTNRDQALINRIIRSAVLGSCRSVTPAEIPRLSRNEDKLRELEIGGQWNIDLGVEAFGKLLVSMPADVRGPVLTTNFDPHIEVAIRRAGGTPFTQWIDIDGKLSTVEDTGAVEVIHVHGLWRRGDTLHTVPQLTRERPMLAGSIREALRGHNVVVVGYSGWPDAFSRTLLAQARERELVGMNIVWCQYSEVTEIDLGRELFRELAIGNATVVYESVDSNRAIPKLFGIYGPKASTVGLQPGISVRGWTSVDPAFLKLRSADADQKANAVRFYEGGEPNWVNALDSTVPVLEFARELERAFRKTHRFICAGVGPMGEGKSLAIRQCLVHLASEPDIDVLWREPGTPLRVQDVLDCEVRPGGTLILGTDDGDLLIDDLAALARELQLAGRSDVRAIIVAAERDWRNRGGFIRLGPHTDLVSTIALSLEDAQRIVDGWSSAELPNLGMLENLPESERAAALRASAVDASGSQETSLIGAMLQVRFGEKLILRVSGLLERLRIQPVGTDQTLEDAFLMICILHSSFKPSDHRSRPLSLRILAAAMGLSETSAQYLVIEPLGKEAAITRHGVDLWTRHDAIADSGVAASRNHDPDHISRILTRLVTAAVRLAGNASPLADDIYAVAYLSRSLLSGRDSIAAGMAACAAEPMRLTYVTSLMAAYREAGMPTEGLQLAEAAWTANREWRDPQSLPLFLTDWAAAAGQAAQPTLNALVGALAFTVDPAHVTELGAQRALLATGVGIRDLHRQTHDRMFLDALGGVIFLAQELTLEPRSQGHLRNHQKYVRENAGGEMSDRREALRALQRALDKLQESPPEVLRDHINKTKLNVLAYRYPGRAGA